MKTIQKLSSQLMKRLFDLKWQSVFIAIIPISLFLFLSITNNQIRYFNSFNLNVNLNSLLIKSAKHVHVNNSLSTELKNSRIAVCLVGGARRFELTGPSIIEKILEKYPNADLFLNSPVDSNSFKFSLLKTAPKIAVIRIFKQEVMPETDDAVRVLTASNSPNGIQGLLQYFNLVEGCLTMIKSYQEQHNFTYNWIVRTRVDGYWSAQLEPDLFIPNHYIVPSGSSYGGLNDRFGIGDFKTSQTALSRHSMIQELDKSGFIQQNSESFFKAQLDLHNISYLTKSVPFCIVSDRTYEFPPQMFGVPVAAISSKGPLSGVKCRPCVSRFSSKWAEEIVNGLARGWSWAESANGKMQLCDGHSEWEEGWEKIFDKVVGKKLSQVRKRVSKLKFDECVEDFETLKRRSDVWDVIPIEEICKQVEKV